MTNTVKLWERKGIYYYAYIYINERSRQGTIVKKLDCISYHIIRLIHGDERLMDMAAHYDPMGDR